MAYKKKEWFDMKRSGLMFELIVRDQDWKKLENIKITPHSFTKTMKDVKNRYGIDKDILEPSQEIQDEMSFLKDAGIINR